MRHHSPKPPQTSGHLSTQVHHNEIDRKCCKTIQDWSSNSASNAEYTPPGFEQHPSDPFYTGMHHNDPNLSVHAQDEFFDDDGDLAFTRRQIMVMKATMRDILKEFQGLSLQKSDLNRTLEDLSEKLPKKSRSTTNTNFIYKKIEIPGRLTL